jgi:aminomethyltransferase
MALRTALYDLHVAVGGKMIEFCGYSLPVVYNNLGITQSVLHTRAAASLFDVSHMGQLRITPRAGTDAGAPYRAAERFATVNVAALKNNAAALSVMLSPSAGILDDTIITRRDGAIDMVVNAGRKMFDIPHIKDVANQFNCDVHVFEDRALLALQGPQAAAVLDKFVGGQIDLKKLSFMQTAEATLSGVDAKYAKIGVARLGYTGEDGFEISVHNDVATKFAQMLTEDSRVAWAGLGARDVLRLEAGLCLMGHDMDPETTPVEADLMWLVGKRRRTEGGFIGYEALMKAVAEHAEKDGRKRIGLLVEGAPAREGAVVMGMGGQTVGKVTSGSPSPVLKKNIAMAYVPNSLAKEGEKVKVVVREKQYEATVSPMPFVPTRYYRAPKE